MDNLAAEREKLLSAAIEILKLFGISIVDYGEGYAYTPMLQEQLRVEGISTAEVVAIDHPMLPAILSASDSKIIVSLASHRIVRNARLGELSALTELQKLWIGLDTEMEGGVDEEDGEENALDFLPDDSESRQNAKLQFLTIRRRRRQLNEFSSYFLRVLQSNHAHYTLLRAYAQQVFGCEETVVKGKNCSDGLLSAERMAKLHRSSNTAEAAILLTYALARAAEKVQSKQELTEKCAKHPSFADCHDAIRAALLNISPSDRLTNSGTRVPPGFAKQLGEMRFFETPEGVVQLVGIGIEAIVTQREGRDGDNLLLEYRTDPQQRIVEKFVVPQKLRQFRSRCRPFRAYCGDRCDLATRRRADQTFLSIPQHYPFFIAAMFDLKGPNCGANVGAAKSGGSRQISLPLAFVHAVN
uniref:EIF3_p135 domain-containing protein n=1 Tax=Globodera pallida TaxID=36090 RepID=A0A183CHM8_GLOPA